MIVTNRTAQVLNANELLKAKQLRFIATLRHVWRLNEEEKSYLNRYFRIKATAAQLIGKIDGAYDEYNYLNYDLLDHNDEQYRVEFIDTSYFEIETLIERKKPDTLFIISCRIHKPTNTYIALIRKAKEHEKCDKTPWIDTPVNENNINEDHSDD